VVGRWLRGAAWAAALGWAAPAVAQVPPASGGGEPAGQDSAAAPDPSTPVGPTEQASAVEPLAEVPASDGPGAPGEASVAPAVSAPRARLMYSSFTAIRVNPLGLVERVRFSYRHRLFANDGALFKGAWVDLVAELTVAPTFVSGGPRLEVRPLSILALAATFEGIGYFGVLGAVMPIASTSSSHWEDTLEARAGENYAARGTRLTLAATLQGKAGPVILVNTVTGLRVDLNLRPGDTLSYDATQDLVLPDGGWAVINDLDLGALVSKAAVGVRYTYADALHGTGGPGDQPTHRVGPLFAWTFHDRPAGARFNRPTLLTLVQWHVSHPYRAGQERNAGIPLVAVALQFDGDLWVSRR
jgi:hypothetical protein